MISRRSVWVAFFGLIFIEILIGCQGAGLSPGSQVSSRPSGYGNHNIVPPLTITDPPRSTVTVTPAEPSKPTDAHARLADVSHAADASHGETTTTSLGKVEDSIHGGEPGDLHKLHDAMMNRAAHLESYIARFRRREVMNGKAQPEEIITFKYRKQPSSVYMKWLRPQDAVGREVIYVKGQHENKLHIQIEKGVLLLGGTKQSFDLNDPMIRGRSRHEITEAGIHEFVNRIHAIVTAMDRDDKSLGTLVYRGETTRPEFDKPVVLLEHVMPPGYEPLLPKGGHRFLYFDQTEQLPLLVVTQDDHGQEVEYYCYDAVQANVKLDDADFNPANLGGGKK
jgi:hypothetical protein